MTPRCVSLILCLAGIPGLIAAQEPAPGGQQPEAPAVAPGSGPRLFVPHKALEFGTVPHGKVIELAVPVTNKGDATLEIHRVRPSCGCTVARFPRRLAPGEQGQIDLVFDSSRRPPGTKAYQVRIQSNDATQTDAGPRTTLLTMGGTVVAIYRLAPQAVYFGAVVAESNPVSRMITVTGLAPELQGGFTVEPQNLPDYLEVQATPVAGLKPPAVKLELRLLPNAPPGRLSSELTFRSSNPTHPQFTLRFSAHVMERFSFAIPELYMGVLERAVGGERRVALLRRDRGRGIPLLDTTCDVPWLQWDIDTTNANQKVLTIAVPRNRPPGPFAATLRVLVDDPRQPLVTLPICGWIAPQLRVVPGALLLPPEPGPDGLLGALQVSIDPRATGKLRGVRVEPTGLPLSATLIPGEQGTQVEVRASGPVPAQGWPADLRLIVESDLAGEEETVVPLRARPR